MPKKEKKRAGRAGHDAACDQSWDFSPWKLTLALVPYRIGTKPVAAGTGFNGGDLAAKVEFGKPELITIDTADEAEQRRVYEALLELRWITPEIRRAVLHALGRSPQAQNASRGRGQTWALRHLVDEVEGRMRANGPEPYGGYRTCALQEVAQKIGMNPQTLQQRFNRLKD
jgi:hypothetical protein